MLHVTDFYPGQIHARLMADGFFGGFVVGFLGTALPRMLSASAFTVLEVGIFLLVYLAMNMAFACAKIIAGDWLFLLLLALFATCGLIRFVRRKDNPPPGFVLVSMGLLCGIGGAALAIIDAKSDEPRWDLLQHLLSYQGFVLFPILGVGPFILPRFFGLPSGHDLAESRQFSAAWRRQATAAGLTTLAILLSFYLEYTGWHRMGPGLRFVAAFLYIACQVPVFQKAKSNNAFTLTLKIAFCLLLTGFVGIVAVPSQRVALLHLTLVGGFAAVTFAVGTRVILGHSGRLAEMSQPNRWFLWVAGVMWFAMLTRISGDFMPKIRFSHYAYGAVVWMVAVAIWAWKILPKTLQRDQEG